MKGLKGMKEEKNKGRTLKFADLFCGIGGFRLGFERAGASCVFSCEKDPTARRVYSDEFTGGFFENLDHPFPDDIRHVGQLPNCDILCAGFPCQDVSTANNQRKGLEGDRTGLFFEIIRLLQSTRNRPRWLVLENVPGLLTSNEGRDFAKIKICLEECGYDISWRVLDSQYFGVPQRRRRIYIVGYLGGICPGEILFESEGGGGDTASLRKEKKDVTYTLTASSGGISGKEQQQTMLATVLPMKGGMEPGRAGMLVAETLTKTQARNGDFERSTVIVGTIDPGGGHNGQDARSGLLVPTVFNWQNAGNEGYAFTENRSSPLDTSQTKAVFSQSMGVRRLTPLECERLQGFPDGWTAGHSDSQRYKCLGNAVTVNVAEWIARRIVSYSEMGMAA